MAGLAVKHAEKIRRFCIVPFYEEISEDARYRRIDVVDWEITQSSGWMCLGLGFLDIKKSDVELELRLPNGEWMRTNDPKSLLMEQ